MTTETSTGYGPRHAGTGYSRLLFDGDERHYEQWEVKFLGYMKLQKLKSVILTPASEEVNRDKNEQAYAELIQFLDDKSLSLVMRDAADDGRKALNILRCHYAGAGKPRVISLYTELTSLVKQADESVTDYVIRAETAASALKNCGETVTDSLLIAMVLKGLPQSYKPFVVVVTQDSDTKTFVEFKCMLRSFEETERARDGGKTDSVMKTSVNNGTKPITCYSCGQAGHIARKCPSKRLSSNKLWCNTCKSSTHTDKTCRRKQKPVQDRVNQLKVSQEEDEAHSFVFKISTSVDQKTNDVHSRLLVDCGATAHIVTDERRFINFDDTFNPAKHFIELADGSKASNVALKRGEVRVTFQNTRGQRVTGTLSNVLFVPTYPQDIFSVQAATEKGAQITFQPDSAKLVDRSGDEFNIDKRGRLYYLTVYDEEEPPDQGDSLYYTCDLKRWHEILGHCNTDDIVKLESVVEGMKVKNKDCKVECDVCVLGKMTNDRSRRPRVRSTVPLQLVHTDLSGPIDPVSSEGFKYAISFTDDFSDASFIYFLKNKSDTVIATEKFLADSAPFGKVKCIRSDNGTEYTSDAFKSLLRRNQIKHETSAPYSPHQNGKAERNWRTLFEMGRCLLLESKLGKELWPYAVMSATYIRNRCYNKRLEQTPYQALTGRKPNIANMRVFGSECFAYTQDKKKLDARCRKGIFVGYDKGSPSYLVYFPETGKIQRFRVVKFLEQSVTSNSINTDDDPIIPKPNPITRPVEPETPMTDNSGQAPSTQNIDPEPGIGQTPRYPSRNRKPPAHLDDYVTEFDDDQLMSNIDYCYRVSSFPQSYREAIESPDCENWKTAMNDEMNSLKVNETFTLTTLPEGRKLVGGRWVYAIKEGSNGIQNYKARFVAKGYSQEKGVDYNETFAPTANLSSIRSLMQIAAQHDLILHQMDVKTAYLNAPIDCEIYMEQPEGFEISSENGEKLVYRLNKSLYGLKQSGRNWNSMLHSYLLENGYVQNPTEHCMYIKQIGTKIIILLIWVDDIIIAASNDKLLNEAKTMLQTKFSMKDLGKLSHFLGIDFTQGQGFVTMSQKTYLIKVLERFQMTDCKPRSTPSEPKLECCDESPADARKYREAVGSLIYAMTCTRPDICYIVTKLSQNLSKPLVAHWTAVKHVLRYIKGTLDYELCYRKCDSNLRLIGYSDADWASSCDDRRSISGYCFSLTDNGPLISWKSRKQPTIALSTCEAEYIALAAAVQESLFLSQWLKHMGNLYEPKPVLIFEDNQGTIALSHNPVGRQRSKHIDIRYHFIRQVLSEGEVILQYCPTSDMVADAMTKPATKVKLDRFRAYIFGQ